MCVCVSSRRRIVYGGFCFFLEDRSIDRSIDRLSPRVVRGCVGCGVEWSGERRFMMMMMMAAVLIEMMDGYHTVRTYNHYALLFVCSVLLSYSFIHSFLYSVALRCVACCCDDNRHPSSCVVGHPVSIDSIDRSIDGTCAFWCCCACVYVVYVVEWSASIERSRIKSNC